MMYYIAQNHDYIDANTAKEFEAHCPDGYTVKRDYYEQLLNAPGRGKWFFYYYCEKGVTIDHLLLGRFISSAELSIGRMFEEKPALKECVEGREKLRDTYLKRNPGLLDRVVIKNIESAIIGLEASQEYYKEILSEEYDEVWNHIAGFCSLISVGNKKYVYSFYDSNSIRERLVQFFYTADELYKVHNYDTCEQFVLFFCEENSIRVTDKLYDWIQNKIKTKDEKTSFNTTAFLTIEGIKKSMAALKQNGNDNTHSPSQERTMNFCPKCGAKLKNSDTFCPTCGCRIE